LGLSVADIVIMSFCDYGPFVCFRVKGVRGAWFEAKLDDEEEPDWGEDLTERKWWEQNQDFKVFSIHVFQASRRR